MLGRARGGRMALGAALVVLGSLCLASTASAKVEVTFAKRVLTVTGTKGNDRIRVFCDQDLKVKMNGRNPAGGPIACGRVVEVDVYGGEGDDRIDMRGVNRRFGKARFRGFGRGTGVAVVAGPGNDRVIGSKTAFNLVFGGPGNDKISGGARRDILSGGPGNDWLNGHRGRDTLLGKGGNDTLIGGPGPDLLSGGPGHDLLRGGPGNDFLGGGRGNDRLYGGPGNDRLYGGPGRDVLVGGPGKNVLVPNPS